jgi:two-component system chemotaxis response regulator CheB
MAQRNILVVGASAGGVEALKVLIAGLPASLPLAVFVVLHLSPYDRSQLASILERVAKLPVQCAQDGMPIVPGRVYVAVPDCHLLLEPNQVRITRGPKENRFRPAVDALFRSAAYHFGPRVIGIVLSGSLDDGTAGLWAVKDRGGIALVQSPDDAPFPSMPQNALAQVDVDHILPVSAMPAALVGLAQEPISSGKAHEISSAMEIETHIALGESTPHVESLQLGPLTPLTCPECHGSLVEVREGPLLRYRCHVGHAFSMQSLLAMINEDIDSAFNQALRTLEERTMLLRKVQQQIVGAEIEPISSYAGLLAESERWEQRVREMIVDHRSFEPDLSTVQLANGKK